MSTVISVRVPKWVKEKLREYGVDIAEVVRKALLEELRKLEEREIDEELERIRRKLFGKLDPEELSRIIDEERWAR